jgi:hypothetical protein
MNKDAKKAADQRAGSDRRQDKDPVFKGSERRTGDRRTKDEPAAK